MKKPSRVCACAGVSGERVYLLLTSQKGTLYRYSKYTHREYRYPTYVYYIVDLEIIYILSYIYTHTRRKEK